MGKKIALIIKKYIRLVSIVLALLFVLSLARNLTSIRSSGNQIGQKREEVAKLEQEQQELEVELKRVESEAFVEQQLRDSLGLAKEGEVVIVLPEDEVLREIGRLKATEKELLPDPTWVKWMKLFEFI